MSYNKMVQDFEQAKSALVSITKGLVEYMTLLGWFLQYFIIFVILVAIAVLGVFCGKKLRENKDRKEAADAMIHSDSQDVK